MTCYGERELEREIDREGKRASERERLNVSH